MDLRLLERPGKIHGIQMHTRGCRKHAILRIKMLGFANQEEHTVRVKRILPQI